ncbi:MAG: dihydroorotase [Bacteroidia bacterium]|nr:dihydroorotase [Bacteroidia bacterium]
MSTLLLKNANIADPGGPFDGKKCDILITDNTIAQIDSQISANADQVIDVNGGFVSTGWIDGLAFCGEPGEEWKEDIRSLAAAASAGGFTSIATCCGNHPYPDKASAISSILRKAENLPANILPLGSATKKQEGKEIAEIYDMFNEGAVAFFDGDAPIQHAGLKTRIMEYTANCNAPLFLYPYNTDLATGGTMHDGIQSNSMGLKGIPSISENCETSANLELAAWLKTPARLIRISTAESVELIRQAKQNGQEVYAAVPVMNLLYTDEDLATFDENFKVLPPLRTNADRLALIEGLMDGTIDAVISNHNPQDSENKDVEFDYAAFGAITIQTVYGMLLKALETKCTAQLIANVLSKGPAKLLGLKVPYIQSGEKAALTVFATNGSWTFNQQTNFSKSKNSPVWGTEVSGSILGTVNNGNWFATNIPATH